MDLRLRRAVPILGAGTAPRPPRAEPSGAAAPSTLTLVRRAWPYIHRYIGGRWVGFGPGSRNDAGLGAAPESAGYLFMPLLVAALCLASLLVAPGPGAPKLALFWTRIGHGLGAALAVVAWAAWLTRGRVRMMLGLAGAVIGVLAATLIWVSAPTLGGKVLGVALPAAFSSGAVLRIRLRGGPALWVRVESHLVYYYLMFALCTGAVALIGAFLTNLLYQSILSAKPLTPGVAGLIGHPEMAHGSARYLGQLYLTVPQRHTLQMYYVTLFLLGGLGGLLSLPTLWISLPYY